MAGRDKLLEPVGEEPILRRTARIAAATGVPVIVVLPPDRPLRAQALAGLGVLQVIAAEAALGMAASLKAGLHAAMAQNARTVMILPADMPSFTTEALAALLAEAKAHPDAILRGTTADGRMGHPALFPADLFPALLALSGDEGGRSVLAAQKARIHPVALPGDMAVLDLDTPEDWAAWRARGA
jgi:molybdenum cofactor cytidylyltransferase